MSKFCQVLKREIVMLLPKENEKKITTDVAVAKGRKMARKGRSDLDHADEEYGRMGKKGMRNIKKKGSKCKKKKKVK